ncbi:hypothetical protein GGR56DRAFT_649347 [Xylariaceae sp. FL0804]|nr:hypothetical protein GGR56DRAFT_649347 [Xylariaceae sp. FL0804]
MCLIFTCGEHTFRKEIQGYEGITCQCHNCGNYSGHVIKSNPWFTFCFIVSPSYSVAARASSRYLAMCRRPSYLPHIPGGQLPVSDAARDVPPPPPPPSSSSSCYCCRCRCRRYPLPISTCAWPALHKHAPAVIWSLTVLTHLSQPVAPLSIHGYQDVVCHICNFSQPLENRPDVLNMKHDGSAGGANMPMQNQGPPPQGPPQGWGGAPGGGGGPPQQQQPMRYG